MRQRRQKRAEDPKPPNHWPKTDDDASPERPKRRFWGARSAQNLAIYIGKRRFSQTRRIRFRRHFGEAFLPSWCLLGRFRLALQRPFGAPECPQSPKRSVAPGNLVRQRRQKRAEDPKPPNQCPKIDDAASPEAPSDDSGRAQASKTSLFAQKTTIVDAC